MPVPPVRHHAVRQEITLDGLRTSYWTNGSGPPILLLHSGEYGASADLSWEYNFDALAERYSVVAADWLGFGRSAKVFDFEQGSEKLVSHLARLCDHLGITSAPVVGSSLGGLLALSDASSAHPRLPSSAIVAICGGGATAKNADVDALFAYDGSVAAMRRVVRSLFPGESWAADEHYVLRRHAQSVAPGAWECVSAPRFHSPLFDSMKQPKRRPDYSRITVPTLLIAGERDTLKPTGWAAELSETIRDSETLVVKEAGHFPHIEQPNSVHAAIFDFLNRRLGEAR